MALPGLESTPTLMDNEQAVTLLKESGDAKVIAVHMDVLDHCHTTRNSHYQKADELKIGKK